MATVDSASQASEAPQERERRPKTCPWPLLTEAQAVMDTPSRRDGVSQAEEIKAGSAAVTLIYGAGERLRVSSFTLATAVVFWRRYFAVRSHKKNDRFIFSVAALFLAAKAEDEPKALNDVIIQCFKFRYRKNPAALSKVKDAKYFESVKEVVLMAERAMLYALGFEFYIHHPYYTVLSVTNKLAKHSDPEVAEFWSTTVKDKIQVAWNFVNDSYRTTLCLQHDMQFIGIAAVDLTLNLLLEKGGIDNVPLVEGKLWWQSHCPDLDVQHLERIKKSILGLYEHIRTVDEDAAGAAPAPDTPDGAMEVGMGGVDAVASLTAEAGTSAQPSPLEVSNGRAAAAGGSNAAQRSPRKRSAANAGLGDPAAQRSPQKRAAADAGHVMQSQGVKRPPGPPPGPPPPPGTVMRPALVPMSGASYAAARGPVPAAAPCSPTHPPLPSVEASGSAGPGPRQSPAVLPPMTGV